MTNNIHCGMAQAKPTWITLRVRRESALYNSSEVARNLYGRLFDKRRSSTQSLGVLSRRFQVHSPLSSARGVDFMMSCSYKSEYACNKQIH